MIAFTATIKQFNEQAEKTGWSYIEVPVEVNEALQPGVKKAYRVKGTIDGEGFSALSLTPMGGGRFILTVNGTIRRKIRKGRGAMVEVRMELDNEELQPPSAFSECLEEEPEAAAYFAALPKSHRNYFINWLNSAKTDETLARRIVQCLNAFHRGWNFGQMIRAGKQANRDNPDLI